MIGSQRFFTWGILSLALVGCSQACAGDLRRPPNIVLILADDLGWGDVGFNGRTDWATPALDRLAANGLRFERFYTAAVVCAPSRAALLTGKATIHCGVSRNDEDLPAEEVTIAEALKAQGYRTALFGKWHHGRPRGKAVPRRNGEEATAYVHPRDQGFDEFFGFTDAIHAWEKFPETLWENRKRVAVSGYADDLFADRAVDFIRQNRDRPFFLYVPFTAPHFNIEAPEDEVARHRGKLPERDPAHPINATYAAMITRLDQHVGRIVEALKIQELTNNTLIVFLSDHGATFEMNNLGASASLDSNRPFRGHKRTLWEGGIRVPAVAVWPGTIKPGSVSTQPTQATDLFPTFLAVAGAAESATSASLQGRNQLDSWINPQTLQQPRTLFWEWRREKADQVAAMRGDLKLVITQGGRPELFNVVLDPAERRDLSAQDPELVQRLQAELQAWLASESPSSTIGPNPAATARAVRTDLKGASQ